MPTSCRSGTSSERFFKLCTRAPRTSMAVGSVKARGVGVSMCSMEARFSRDMQSAPRRGGALSNSGANERIRTADLRITRGKRPDQIGFLVSICARTAPYRGRLGSFAFFRVRARWHTIGTRPEAPELES